MSDLKRPCVIDTNVLLAANKDARDQVSLECAAKCAKVLNDIRRFGHVVVDNLRRIVSEYQNKTLKKGRQREAGDEFLLWLLQNLWVKERCTQVPVTSKQEDDLDFEEFPDTDGLRRFDRSDRVFVAVANAHNPKAPILQACDSDYWDAWEHLAACGIHIEFLCPDDMKRIIDGRQS